MWCGVCGAGAVLVRCGLVVERRISQARFVASASACEFSPKAKAPHSTPSVSTRHSASTHAPGFREPSAAHKWETRLRPIPMQQPRAQGATPQRSAPRERDCQGKNAFVAASEASPARATRPAPALPQPVPAASNYARPSGPFITHDKLTVEQDTMQSVQVRAQGPCRTAEHSCRSPSCWPRTAHAPAARTPYSHCAC